MGLPEMNTPEAVLPQGSAVRARAVESLRTALQMAPSTSESRLRSGPVDHGRLAQTWNRVDAEAAALAGCRNPVAQRHADRDPAEHL